MTENLAKTEASVELSDEKSSENLDYYLNKIGAADVIDRFSPYDKRTMAVPLILHLEPLPVPQKPSTERDRMVAFFEGQNWLPKQRQEATIASLTGIDETLRRAKKTKKGDPLRAQKSFLASIRGYDQEAIKDEKILSAVRIPTEEMTIIPDIDRLRTDRAALYTLADYLMAREFLDKAEWPSSNSHAYRDRQSYWRGFMIFAGQHAPEEVLKDVFNYYFDKAQERRNFWSEKFKNVNGKIGHLAVEDVAMTVIPERPVEEISYKSGNRPDIDSFNEMLSDKAVDELATAAAKYTDKTDQIMRYVQDQGMSQAQAELRVLGRRAEWHEGHIVGLKPIDDKPSPEAIEKAKKPASNASLKPGVRRLPGYDQERDPSNPQPF
ncbi:hypothetical protein KW801_00445 [Candidatus Saccharibacteria bacterium]|nr:hypothetical protein [Candidatus Saccharibacteria bacterium]